MIDVETLQVHKTCHIILNKTQFPFHNPKICENSLQFKLNCCHFASILISSPAVITHKLTATSFLFFYGLKALFNLVRPWQVRGGRLVGHTMQSQTEHFFFFFLKQLFNGWMTFQTWLIEIRLHDKKVFWKEVWPDDVIWRCSWYYLKQFKCFSLHIICLKVTLILQMLADLCPLFLLTWTVVGWTLYYLLYF